MVDGGGRGGIGAAVDFLLFSGNGGMILREAAAVFIALRGSDFGRAAGAGGHAGGGSTAGLGFMYVFAIFNSLLTVAFTRRSRT